MKKFIVLYQAPISAMEQMAKASPEQTKAGMDAWTAWAKKAATAIVDLGMPLGNGASVTKAAVTTGATKVVGYSVMQGESMKAVTQLLEGHPHLFMPGFTIEVLETLPMPGMT
jgi:hypothetical protein